MTKNATAYKHINTEDLNTTKKTEGYIKASHNAAALREVSDYCDTKWNRATSEAMQDAWASLSDKAHKKAKALEAPKAEAPKAAEVQTAPKAEAPKAAEVQTAPKAEAPKAEAVPADMMQTMMQTMMQSMMPQMQTMMQTMMQSMMPTIEAPKAEAPKAAEDAKKAAEKKQKAIDKVQKTADELYRRKECAIAELNAKYDADVAKLLKAEGLKDSDVFVSAIREEAKENRGKAFAKYNNKGNEDQRRQSIENFAKQYGLTTFEFTRKFKKPTAEGIEGGVYIGFIGIGREDVKVREDLKKRWPKAGYDNASKTWSVFLKYDA